MAKSLYKSGVYKSDAYGPVAFSPGAIFINYCFSLAWLWFMWGAYRRYGIPHEFGDKLLFLISFIFGLGWFLGNVYFTVGRFKYSDVQLETRGRVVPGGKLTTVLRIARGLAGTRSLAAKLLCLDRRWERTGETGSRLIDYVIWSAEADFPVVTRGRRSECRIEFDVPESAVTTSTSANMLGVKDSGIHWVLEVYADVPGVDLARSFVVRVVSGTVAGVTRAAPASQQRKM